MNKQELINHIEEVKGDKPHYREQYHLGRWQAIEGVLELINQLDEPEIAEEPTFLEHLTRLFKKHGYDHLGQVALALENDLEISINKELPAIPQFIAETIEKYKENDNSLGELLSSVEHANIKYYHGLEKYRVDFNDSYPQIVDLCATIARAWLDGYAISPPKTLQVIIKNYDSTVYKTDIPEDEAMKLIEGWKGNE